MKTVETQKENFTVSQENKIGNKLLVSEILQIKQINEKKNEVKEIQRDKLQKQENSVLNFVTKAKRFDTVKNLQFSNKIKESLISLTQITNSFASQINRDQSSHFLGNTLPANAALGKIIMTKISQISEQKSTVEKETAYFTAKEKDRYNAAKRSENILQIKNNIYIDGELHKAETSTKRAGN